MTIILILAYAVKMYLQFRNVTNFLRNDTIIKSTFAIVITCIALLIIINCFLPNKREETKANKEDDTKKGREKTERIGGRATTSHDSEFNNDSKIADAIIVFSVIYIIIFIVFFYCLIDGMQKEYSLMFSIRPVLLPSFLFDIVLTEYIRGIKKEGNNRIISFINTIIIELFSCLIAVVIVTLLLAVLFGVGIYLALLIALMPFSIFLMLFKD